MTAHEILAEHVKAARLTVRDIEAFVADGVPVSAFALFRDDRHAWLGRDRVVFDDAGRFEFERHAKGGEAVNVFTTIAWDECGDPSDLVAWRPGRIGTWLGAASVLGAELVLEPRVADEAIDVWPDMMAWLRADRRGIVVLDPRRAASLLHMAPPLRVQSVEQGRALRAALTIEAPRIVVAEILYIVQDSLGRAA